MNLDHAIAALATAVNNLPDVDTNGMKVYQAGFIMVQVKVLRRVVGYLSALSVTLIEDARFPTAKRYLDARD